MTEADLAEVTELVSTNYPGVFWWQPMITHDPKTEWVKITEN